MEFKRINQIQLLDKRFSEILLTTLFIIISSLWLFKSNKEFNLSSSNQINFYSKGKVFNLPRILTFYLVIHMNIGVHM